ncbi:hypothetical protein DPEC_G00230810 [Dallia pectoralis]|uniref:Uncharacterized protein n=1 Tax=Dallia pectoralis TaxID=75939 RepID=A0ACC2G225_DALPE|nr:hypothetical protein DPEC_G00230810 [Dallia pectoralis]
MLEGHPAHLKQNGGHHLHCRHQGQRPARGPRQPPGVLQLFLNTPSQHHLGGTRPMRRPPTSDEDTDGEQQSGPFVPELSTSTPPRRDEPLMELTSDEEDQDGEQQPEPLVLPVTKDGRETVPEPIRFCCAQGNHTNT